MLATIPLPEPEQPEPEPEQLHLSIQPLQCSYRRKFPELERVASNDPELTGLFWHSRRVDDGLLGALAADLAGNEHVRLINLNQNYGVTDDGIAYLEAVLGSCAVEHIRLGKTSVTDERAASVHHQCMRKQLARLRANDASLTRLRWQYAMAKAHADPTMPAQLADAVRGNNQLREIDLTQVQEDGHLFRPLPSLP
jgi:hypothetical protein